MDKKAHASFLSLAFSKAVVTMALKVAMVVGSILALINHGDTIINMTFTPKNLTQILLTYLVPYCVSTWSAVKAIRNQMAK